ncbi:MAG: 3-phenylpropionate/trans-cinnamate dioxygenase ferredoxin reductase component [Alphaproteobacteria bacterium]|nr:3-phenylpropionate/trans-cinnamate dioxygenase ferredoxin reductase component [Alphaproteobacteria bacterium]
MSGGILILGAGQAAAQLAISLRQGGYAGGLRMIGDEPYAPYQRPPLSKAFLKERPSADTLLLRRESYWADHQVALELGTAAAAVDLARKQVSLGDGRTHDYDTLVFATGTRARDLPLPGVGLPGVFSLRKIDDVRRLRPALDDARRVAIVGGGYIGLEVAAVMRQEGREATVVEAEGRVMKRVAGETISGFFETLHRSRGVDIRLGARLAAIDGDSRATGVTLASGERIAADLVLVATGARANDDLAAASGLPCEDGIVVDDVARAAPDVYAIGDCARFYSHRYGRKIRLECVQNAVDQAKAVADAIMGKPKPYDPVPWFWSDQYEVKLQITGLLDGFEAAETVGNPADGKFSVEYRKAGKLIAVDAVSDGRAHMLGRRRIAVDLPEFGAAS